jgi:hypothetical protein
MMKRNSKLSRRWRGRRDYVNHALGGVVLLAAYELSTLDGHLADVRERLSVARSARSLRQLVRDQVDLLPETRVRLAHDGKERRELVRGWLECLKRLEARAA